MRMIKEVAVKEDGRLITYYWFENKLGLQNVEGRQYASSCVGTLSQEQSVIADKLVNKTHKSKSTL